jgi:ribosomal protein S8E
MSVVSTKTGLALQIYAKTIAAVERKNVFKELCTVQTIMSGFSHRFNVMGTGIDTDVSSFALGSNPAETQLSVNKRDITVDRTLTSRKKIDNWEKKAANFDMVSAAVDQNATSMAIKIDKLVVAELNTAMGEAQLLAEDGSGKVVQDSAGEVTDTVIGTGTTAEAKGDALLEAMFAAGSVLEGKDQVGKQRYFVTSPTMYDKLVLSKKGVNADYNSGANGSIAEGNVLTIDGVQILKSNNLDTAPSNISAGTTLAGWFFTEDVIGITELIGLNTTEWEEKKEKCYYTDVEYAAGFGVLNPASLVAITY